MKMQDPLGIVVPRGVLRIQLSLWEWWAGWEGQFTVFANFHGISTPLWLISIYQKLTICW